MKKILLALTLILGIGVAAHAQSKPAEFKFVEETFDFGKIPAGKPVTHVFKFTNIGDEPLIIKNAEATCGCTKPTFSATPVKKGESGTISVTYNAAGDPQQFAKTVTVTSNAKTPVKVLYIKGETVSATR